MSEARQVPGLGGGWPASPVAHGIARNNSEIAAELSISSRTVERHVANALHRLGLRSGVEQAR